MPSVAFRTPNLFGAGWGTRGRGGGWAPFLLSVLLPVFAVSSATCRRPQKRPSPVRRSKPKSSWDLWVPGRILGQ